MVGEVGIHDDNKVARDKLQAMNVCSSQTKLARSRFQKDAVRTEGST
jgi:hypothetical protein